MQVDPINPTVKAPGIKRLKVHFDKPLSNFALEFKLRRYILDEFHDKARIAEMNENLVIVWLDSLFLFALVGRCRLTLSKPR